GLTALTIKKKSYNGLGLVALAVGDIVAGISATLQLDPPLPTGCSRILEMCTGESMRHSERRRPRAQMILGPR
ncbi:MAG TPA: hypothetical protein VKG65_03515, partial [Terriglobales bacterium]|nr:hypothetical protein [Terriglobales bacterium]